MRNKKILITALIVMMVVSFSACGNSELESLRADSISRIEAFDTSQFKGEDLEEVNELIEEAKEDIAEADSEDEINEIISELESDMDEVRTGKPSFGSPDSEGCID